MAEKILIIGGGAAGMMAGIAAARAGAHPIILEGGERVGKKILATGNGKCNYTNLNMDEDCFNCSQPGFVEKVLDLFDEDDTLNFFESIGIIPRIRNGYVYPRSEQAAAVLDALRLELNRLGVEIRTGFKAEEILYKKNSRKNSEYKKPADDQEMNEDRHFTVRSGIESLEADKIILATGGCASPKTGSDGSGYKLAESLGHTVIPVIPALVQLRVREKFMKSVSGVRTQANVHIYVKGTMTASDEGEVQLTDYGISGIPVFQVSRHAARALTEGKDVTARLDFLPELEWDEAAGMLKRWKKSHPEAFVEELLLGVIPKKLAELVVRLCREEARYLKDNRKSSGKNVEPEISTVVDKLKNFTLHVTDTNGFDNAQVCGGGVDTSEIHPDSCQSRLVPGLYLTGELLDVDGICGGYNLQWAWSTGMLAGTHAAGPKADRTRRTSSKNDVSRFNGRRR